MTNNLTDPVSIPRDAVTSAAGALTSRQAEETVTIEEQVDQLKAAGWTHVRGSLWKAPIGGYFMGPHGAWLAMRRRFRG